LTLVVLLVLAALWAVVLLPPLLKSRATRLQSSDSIGDFNYKLDVLSRTNGSTTRRPRRSSERSVSMSRPLPLPQYGAPYGSARGARRPVGSSSASSTARAAKRRGDVLRILAITVVGTMALAYFTGSTAMWAVQVLADIALVAFLGLWAWARNVQADHARTVRYMPQRRTPEFALRRTASS
jgi:hypothetical protein